MHLEKKLKEMKTMSSIRFSESLGKEEYYLDQNPRDHKKVHECLHTHSTE
jgi:hypothetical protein